MQPNKLHQEIKRTSCFPQGARILVAVSGGADSVALLYLLHQLAPAMQWRLGVAHLNHKLRGRDAEGDEQFVGSLAKTLELPFHRRRKDVAKAARPRKQSIEMAARDIRYGFFADLVARHGYDAVALAHTRDDQAETLLLRLLRGSGMAGLGAMAPVARVGGLLLWRPLLDVSKGALIGYLRKRGVTWREDASNDDATYLRNRVRHELMPLLRDRFNPNIATTLARTADLLHEDDAVLNELAREDVQGCTAEDGRTLEVKRLQQLSRARLRRVLLNWLLDAGVEAAPPDFDVIERLCALCRSVKGTAEVPVQGAVRAVRTYGRLALSGRLKAGWSGGPSRHKVKVPGRTIIREQGVRVFTRWTHGYERPEREHCGRLPAETWLSAKAMGRAALYIRSRKDGDRFAPLGMRGAKKVQDIFVDEKVPREERDAVPLVVCRNQIVWIPGFRVARDWAVAKDSSPSLHIRIEPLKAV